VPVIGTAGHVDHGKTALIAALTGVDTDRLPEERARGMTTDLGFASFEGGGMRIGVIDVPGHERYIRNMVAGAWGIDGALLVVAADDGWMRQTERHAEVLAALGVPILAIVVTKIDKVPSGRPGQVAGEVGSRLAALDPATPLPPWVGVDCLRGTGVAELRELLPTLLAARAASGKTLSAGGGSTGAEVFVDRAFVLAGSGAVVAGSLRGGVLTPGSELRHLPSGETLRLRSLQVYGRLAERAEAGSRVALGFQRSGIEIRRGDCLAAAGSSFSNATSCYLALDAARAAWRPRAGLALEAATGTSHRDARVWPARALGFLRLSVDEALGLAPGQALVLLRKGGADILAAGRVLALGGMSTEERRAIEAALPAAALAIGRITSSVRFEEVVAAFELERRGFVSASSDDRLPAGAERAGAWLFSALQWATSKRLAEAAAAEPGGQSPAGLAGRLGLPKAAAEALLGRLIDEGLLRLEGGGVRGGEGGELLPDKLRRLAERLERAGRAGLDLEAEATPGLRRDLALLCRLGRATSLDGRLYLSPGAYKDLSMMILGGRREESRFTVAQAKSATGLSRKWILPLLNRMEDEGRVRREGEERVVGRGG